MHTDTDRDIVRYRNRHSMHTDTDTDIECMHTDTDTDLVTWTQDTASDIDMNEYRPRQT